MEIKVFVANLSKYNEGTMKGAWLDLPMEPEELEEAMKAILGDDEEWIILDWEAPFRIGEYDNLFELNEKMEELAELADDNCLGEDEIEALFEYAYDLDEALTFLNDGELHFYNLPEATWAALAEELVYEHGYLGDLPDHVKDYLDFEKIGRDLKCGGGWHLAKNGVAIEHH